MARKYCHLTGTLPFMARRDSDEYYILDFCDAVLGVPSDRQKKFDWLLGDPGKQGTQRRLPVDGYWESLGLVVEYHERQHDEAEKLFDKPELTVSGVPRREQRRIYDLRREQEIPAHGPTLVVIKASAFTTRGRYIVRDAVRDRDVVRSSLNSVASVGDRP